LGHEAVLVRDDEDDDGERSRLVLADRLVSTPFLQPEALDDDAGPDDDDVDDDNDDDDDDWGLLLDRVDPDVQSVLPACAGNVTGDVLRWSFDDVAEDADVNGDSRPRVRAAVVADAADDEDVDSELISLPVDCVAASPNDKQINSTVF